MKMLIIKNKIKNIFYSIIIMEQYISNPKKFNLISLESYTIQSVIYKTPTIVLRKEIPNGYDIAGIHIDEFPENLKYIIIEFGGVHSNIKFDSDMIDYMKSFPFYLTLCENFNVNMKFVYDEKWFESNQEYIMEDEYIDVEELGDEVTIFDGNEYHTGQIVNNYKKPTGKKVRKVTKGPDVIIPKVTFDIVLSIKDKSIAMEQIVKQKLDLRSLRREIGSEEKLNIFINDVLKVKHNFKEIDENTCYIDNIVRYFKGFVGLAYSF